MSHARSSSASADEGAAPIEVVPSEDRPSESSWGSWGWGFASTMVTKTSELMSKVADAIDVDEEERLAMEAAEREEEERLRARAAEKEADEGEDEDRLLQYIDSGVELFGSSIEKLGGFLNQGVDKLQTSNMDEAMSKSLALLERAGSSAYSALKEELNSVIGEQYGVPESPARDPRAPPSSMLLRKDESKTFVKEFEAVGGGQALRALEELSVDCMMKSQTIYGSLDFARRQNLVDEMAKVTEVFKRDPFSNSNALSDNITAPYAKYQAALKVGNALADRTEVQWKDIKENVAESAEFKKIIGENEKEVKKTDNRSESGTSEAQSLTRAQLLYSGAADYQKQLRIEYLEQLAIVVSLMLELVSVALQILSEAAEGSAPLDVLAAASAMRVLSDELQSALAHLTSAYKESLKLVYTLAKVDIETVASEEATAGILKSLKSKVQSSADSLMIDSGTALGHLQTARKATVSVCKYLLFAFSQRKPAPLDPTTTAMTQTTPQTTPAKIRGEKREEPEAPASPRQVRGKTGVTPSSPSDA